ncbi:MAG: hypothetical protein QM809_07845 [Gordonia sp. (in: high G+C Gram-positive bacteria)]|uniref:hypothetical protein n=1 Tax=Gordonia sp. (in: high G+C Gram-positive bacteria) TaxID=84139 RepID=UPI0039E2CA8D
MSELLAHIDQRAAAMPWMTAVRFSGTAVSYGDLRDRIGEYDVVLARQALSENAALAAALISFFPEAVRGLTPGEQAQWVADAIAWMSRGLGNGGTSLIAAV